jgi:hypothetical protein
MDAATSQSDVLLLVTADQNLYAGDPIHFQLVPLADKLLVRTGEPIATLGPIPGGKNASAALALYELLGPTGAVPRAMAQRGMPVNFVANVKLDRTLPSVDDMQRMLAIGGGSYIMTAFATADTYPHSFGEHVVVALQKAPAE